MENQGSEVKRAEPESEPSSSPVLRPHWQRTGDGRGRRSGAERRPPSPLGLSKAHISARTRHGTMTCYRNASLLEVRLRSDVMPGKGRSAPRGEITEFTPAARRARARGNGSRRSRQKTIRGNGAKLDYLNSKPSPSLRVFDAAAGRSGRVEWRAVRRTWGKARSGGLTLGVSGSGVALALLAWTVAKTVPCRGRKRGEVEIAAKEPSMVARFHRQAVLQRGILVAMFGGTRYTKQSSSR